MPCWRLRAQPPCDGARGGQDHILEGKRCGSVGVACEWLLWWEEHLGRGVEGGHEGGVAEGWGRLPQSLCSLEFGADLRIGKGP